MMAWNKSSSFRRFHKLSIVQIVGFLSITIVFINEFLVYSIQSFRWNTVPISRDASEELVLLLVSDPQLIGIQDEIGFPVGTLARWDSDRYLRKTFSRAFQHSQPDVVVFLGDLMDEGSKATPEEYKTYYHRFNSIFYEAIDQKSIMVPGDNDIGGEGGDFRTTLKVNRFQKYFENLTGVVNHGFVDFIKLDIQLHRDQLLEKKQEISKMARKLSAPIRILVNHESVLPKMKNMIYPILKMSQPNLILSGHWHLSQVFSCDSCLSDNKDSAHWPYNRRHIDHEKDYIKVDLTDLIAITEIAVPTCSYRMGVPYMGYGVLILKSTGHVMYTVLWSPSRYTVLYVYVAALVVFVVVLCVNFIISSSTTSNHKFYR